MSDDNLADNEEREVGAFPGGSPFYDGGTTAPGKHAFRQGTPPVQRPRVPVTASALDPEELYQRLDRGLALVERRETLQQGLDDLYALRDDIHRLLR